MYICEHCNTLSDTFICEHCGGQTTTPSPRVDLDAIHRLKTPLPRFPHNIPLRPIHEVEQNILQKMIDASPYYLLKYGGLAIDRVLLSIDQKKNPYLYYLAYGVGKGLAYVRRKLYVE
jgi:hypothetical protein